MIPYKWYDYFIASLTVLLMLTFTFLSMFMLEVRWCVGTMISGYIGGIYMGLRTEWLDK